jgi:hypothetical protein
MGSGANFKSQLGFHYIHKLLPIHHVVYNFILKALSFEKVTMQGLEIHFYLWAFEWDMLMKLDLITQFYENFPNPILKAHANSTTLALKRRQVR